MVKALEFGEGIIPDSDAEWRIAAFRRTDNLAAGEW